MSEQKKKISNRTLFTLCGVLLLLAAISFVSLLDISWASLFPTAEDLDRVRRDEKKLKIQLYELEVKNDELLRTEQRYKNLTAECWDEAVLGSPDVLLPKRISDLAKELNIDSINTSPVKRNKLNGDLILLELDVNINASLEEMTKFWTQLAAQKPPVAWKRIELRSGNQQMGEQLVFRGTACLFGREAAAPAAAPVTAVEKAAAAPAAEKTAAAPAAEKTAAKEKAL